MFGTKRKLNDLQKAQEIIKIGHNFLTFFNNLTTLIELKKYAVKNLLYTKLTYSESIQFNYLVTRLTRGHTRIILLKRNNFPDYAIQPLKFASISDSITDLLSLK